SFRSIFYPSIKGWHFEWFTIENRNKGLTAEAVSCFSESVAGRTVNVLENTIPGDLLLELDYSKLYLEKKTHEESQDEVIMVLDDIVVDILAASGTSSKPLAPGDPVDDISHGNAPT
ncbi:hypothetical protein ACJX0J_031090, partial [Zea mays]